MKILMNNAKSEKQSQNYYFEMSYEGDFYENFPMSELFDFLMVRTECVYFRNQLLTSTSLEKLHQTKYNDSLDVPLMCYKHFVEHGDLKRDPVIAIYGLPNRLFYTHLCDGLE